jgi:hypothetical protein
MRLPVRYAPLTFAVFMSIYMVTLMTFVITWANTGLGDGFLARWWRAFYIAWPIAFALISSAHRACSAWWAAGSTKTLPDLNENAD